MILFNTENELMLEVCTILDTTAILFTNRPLFKCSYYSKSGVFGNTGIENEWNEHELTSIPCV